MAAERGAVAVRALPSPGGDASYDRVPPHNLDAELSVIGSMLLSRDAIAEVSELVGPEEFYRGAHRTMFEGIRSLYDRGEPVDAVTLADELQRHGSLEDVGGAGGIADVVARVPTAANALYYARIVAAQSLRRRLIDCGTQITRLGYTDTEEVGESVDQAEQLVYNMSQQGRVSEFVAIKSLLNAGFARIETLHESNQAVTGLATGFADLDELTAGLQPSNLIVLAARPSMGKSTMVTNIATHVAVELRKSVVLFSLEMSSMELIQRILAAEARVDSDRLRTGRLVDADWPKLSQAMGRLAETQLHIDDTPGINLLEIRSKARRLKQRHGLDLIIVDYLQLMQSHRRVENRVQEVSELSRGLKILSKELDIPVIALSQLSRRPEERHDRRPQLSDLRESGCLTGETEVVLATGATAPLASLCGQQVEVATLDGWRMAVASASKVWRTGTRPVFRLRLASGREVRATGNHRFRTLLDWRPLAKLAQGDRIAVPRRCATPTTVRNRPQVESYAAALGSTELEGQAAADVSGDVYWDRVVEIQADGVEDVYDMTVPGTHNFVAGGVVVHNSIEQDADVVCFIYRDEVYDQESAAKGEAELIVAKHRNGPLATIRLAFLGSTSRFASLRRGGVAGTPPGVSPGPPPDRPW